MRVFLLTLAALACSATSLEARIQKRGILGYKLGYKLGTHTGVKLGSKIGYKIGAATAGLENAALALDSGFHNGYATHFGSYASGYAHTGFGHDELHGDYHHVHNVPVPVPVPQPYPVHIVKKVPFAVPVDRPYPVPFPKPYAVPVDRPYPVDRPVPYPVKVPVLVKDHDFHHHHHHEEYNDGYSTLHDVHDHHHHQDW